MFPLPTTAAAAAWVRPIAVRAHAGVLLLFRYVRGKGDANAPPIHNHSRTRLARRGRRWLSAARAALGLGTLTLVCWLFWPASTSGAEPILPPLYGAYHQQELWLPQHNVHLPAPEGKHGKYIWFANHATSSGWSNVMQEHLLNSLLAYESKRGYVFENYTWNTNKEEDYSTYNGRRIPSRIPFTTVLSGPAVGGPFPAGDPAPRAVLKEYFDFVCPPSARTVIHSADVVPWETDLSAARILERWVVKLAQTDARCVEIDSTSGQIFNIFLFGSPERLTDIWPVLSRSPVLRGFGWSPLVQTAFEANRALFDPRHALAFDTRAGAGGPPGVVPGLLALHIRRGDFETHCPDVLSRWRSTFAGFNGFPAFPDQWIPAPADADEFARQTLYQPHCLPSIEDVVRKVETIRAAHGTPLQAVYIMTNAKRVWADKLVQALRVRHQWALAAHSREMALDWEQQYIAQAPDMVIGQRAEVFIGNGFSSMTAMISMLRIADGHAMENTRFW